MGTLCLRDVPDEVVEGLERMAAAAGTSVSAVAIQELAAASRRWYNATLLAELGESADRPDRAAEVVAALGAARAER